MILYNSMGELRLCNKNLTKIPNEVLQLDDLVLLDLSNNSIEVIPDDINKITGLKFLILSNNNISHLPIINLPNLEALVLCNNKITSIDNIDELPELVNLYIDHNPITRIPKKIFQLKNLRSLVANDCNILNLPSGINKYLENMEFYIYNNQLKDFSLKQEDNSEEITTYYNNVQHCSKLLNKIKIQLWFSNHVIPKYFEKSNDIYIDI